MGFVWAPARLALRWPRENLSVALPQHDFEMLENILTGTPCYHCCQGSNLYRWLNLEELLDIDTRVAGYCWVASNELLDISKIGR